MFLLCIYGAVLPGLEKSMRFRTFDDDPVKPEDLEPGSLSFLGIEARIPGEKGFQRRCLYSDYAPNKI